MSPRQRLGLAAALSAVAAVSLFFYNTGAQDARGDAGSSTSVSSPPAGAAATRDREFTALEQQLRKKPDHGPVLFRMAQLARESGRLQQAADYFRRAAQAEPGSSDARLELGRVFYELGDVQGALRETLDILKGNPGHVDALYNAGAIYANSGDLEKAKQYWRRAVRAGAATEGGNKARNALRQIGAG